ncbi:hypothetical protein A1O3_08778 [Capronia epimyces CBS 606.96]|uniref:HMG box domain-containing protein n=1 Tax=Capronia epimyces CBS 606.96 TaxID=1182542 RepID=W9XQM0_9EURO|nr:uncharacterized protein A1O3_08778 [Capronia epimyces CBS 606.96]EXJ79276.1 hypothetical protein A1O3_08778 [Capronia epimyces CBS 606.96]
MTDLAPHLERLGLEQYLDAFVGEGFDTWETLTDIQESDFDVLNVKLGHRRKLQRAIADYRGISYERLVGSPAQEGPPDTGRAPESSATPAIATERGPGPVPETKRKYRRHPKPDENAPERPPSAYVIFSNKVREEVKDQNLSFTQIAKLVGDRWQKLDPAGKEPFETQANAAKERYNIQLSTYRKTEAYKEYMQYLADFKSKHGQTSEQKRPKLDPESSGSIISARSLESNPEVASQLSSHVRGGSMGSMASSPFIGGGRQPTPSGASMPSRPQLASSRSGSPPPLQQGREFYRPSLPSRHSSLSDESSTVRSDLPEPLVRTATLSLGVTPSSSGTPPLQPGPPGALSLDSSGSPDLPERSRLLYGVQQQHQQAQPQLQPQHQPQLQHQHQHQHQPQQHSALSTVPGIGSAQPAPSVPFPPTFPSPTMPERPWGSRPSDIRGYLETPAGGPSSLSYSPVGIPQPNPAQLPPFFPPDRLPEYSPGAYLRTLPPPRSRSTGHPALRESGSPVLTSALTLRRPGQEEIRAVLERSENDAANALAGLAATPVSRPDTTKPLSYSLPPRSAP